MDQSSSMDMLIPLWILGAPLLLALVSLFSTPKGSRVDENDLRTQR